MLTAIDRNHRRIVALLFALMLVVGLLITPDYGMPRDELTEIRALGSNVREYAAAIRWSPDRHGSRCTDCMRTWTG